MKKILIITLIFLTLFTIKFVNKTKVYALEKKDIYIQQFTFENKSYDGKEIGEPIFLVQDNLGNKIELSKTDYTIKYQKAMLGLTETKPKTNGNYTAYLSIINPIYNCSAIVDNYNAFCNFEITKAPGFTINVKDTIICEGMKLATPSFDILNGTCYDSLTLNYYLIIDGIEKNFNELSSSELKNGIYDLVLKIGILPYYENIEITNAKYYVNKKNIIQDNNCMQIVVSKHLGINPNYILSIQNNETHKQLFSEQTKVILSFDLHFFENNEKLTLGDSTLKIKYLVEDLSKFKIYSVNNSQIQNIHYAISDGDIIFETQDNMSSFVFVYEKEKINFMPFSILMIFISMLEVFLAIKVFGLNSKISMYGIIAPTWCLLFFDNIDLIIFFLSLWVTLLSTLLLIYSIFKDNAKFNKILALCDTKKSTKNTNSKKSLKSEIDIEDKELYNLIALKKQNEMLELEEIIEDNNNTNS